MAVYHKDFKEQYDALAVNMRAEGITRGEKTAGKFEGMPAPNLELSILDKLKGKPGGLSLTELRASLGPKVRPSMGSQEKAKAKADFDQAVLNLYRDRRVYLDRHDHPMRLSDAERKDLVTDGAGNYYVGITLRGDFD
jgi:hypothetical protein